MGGLLVFRHFYRTLWLSVANFGRGNNRAGKGIEEDTEMVLKR